MRGDSFVSEPGVQVVVPAPKSEPWTQERFVQALQKAKVHHVGIGANAEAWFREVQEAVSTGLMTFEDYIHVRGNCQQAKFDHRVAMSNAYDKYHTS